MMKLRSILPALAIAGFVLFTGCKSTGSDCCGTCGATCGGGEMPTTAAEQEATTPDAVLKQLMEGNKRYVAGERTAIAIQPSREAATAGQWPVAYVLSCVDSRVPVEVVFDQGIGDMFVGRVAGNFESSEQLGSMEFATAVAGAKLVMVLGHEACGAVKGSVDNPDLPKEFANLPPLLKDIRPAVDSVKYTGDRSSKNKKFVDAVIEANVKKTVEDIRTRSPILAQLEKDGKIKIVGGVYSLETGAVTLLK